MKKMDEYFKKQLQDHSTSEDGWNMPSEELWERASKEFPKPKRDKKRFYFFLLAGFLIGFSGLMFLLFKSDEIDTKNIANSELLKLENVEAKESFETESKNDNSLILNIKSKDINDETYHEENKNQTILNVKAETLKIDKENPIEYFKKNENPKTLTANKITKSDSQIEKPINKKRAKENISNKNATPSLIDSSMSIESNQKPIILNKKPAVATNNINSKSSRTTDLNYLGGGQHLGVVTSNALPLKEIEFPTSSTIVHKEKRKWELGVTIATYSLGAPYTLSSTNPNDDVDFVNIDSDFFGLNFLISKPIGKRFSLSSGLRFSTQSLKLTAGVDKEWGTITGSNVEFSSENFLPQQIELMINNMVNLEPDDILEIRGKAHVHMYSAAIPLQLNYHFQKNKWEYLLSLGGFIGFDGFLNGNMDIEFKNENQILGRTEEVVEGGFVPQASIYAGFGVKYHMNKKWNLGSNVMLDSRVGLPGNYLRLEMGLFMSL